MGNFKKDLDKGKKAENYICTFLQKWYPNTSVFNGKKKEFDIEIPEIKEQLEVKYDRMSKDTGNLAIEFEFCGKPSGIKATTSQRWCVVFGKDEGWYFAFVETGSLIKMCEGKRVVSGGDGYMAKMFLLPVQEIFDNPFIKIHPIAKIDG